MGVVGAREKRDESFGSGSASLELDSFWPSATAGSLLLTALRRRASSDDEPPSTGNAMTDGAVIMAEHMTMQAKSSQDEGFMVAEWADDDDDESEEEVDCEAVGLVPLPAWVRVTVRTTTFPSVAMP